MPDREKVIKAIEICYSEKHNCTECELFHVEDCNGQLMRDVLELLKEQGPDNSKYEYKHDHTDCLWYGNDNWNQCPSTCSQYRDGWNDAMDYVFKNGKGYNPYVRR